MVPAAAKMMASCCRKNDGFLLPQKFTLPLRTMSLS